MDELPAHLKTELALHLNNDLIQVPLECISFPTSRPQSRPFGDKAVPFLRDMGSDCQVLLVMRLKPLQIAPKQFVFKKGMLGREMFFVSKVCFCRCSPGGLTLGSRTGRCRGHRGGRQHHLRAGARQLLWVRSSPTEVLV